MHDADNDRSPAYISDTAAARRSALKRPGLRSASTTDHIKPRLSTKFGERAVSFAGPNVCNNLPDELRHITNVNN